MATVLAVYTSQGCAGRCDARCHNARGLICRCICGGINHGVGARQAANNAAGMGEELLQKWREEHQDTPVATQLLLPLEV